MRRLFWAMVRSSFSASCYREVARHWRGFGFTYLVFVAAFCGAVLLPKAISDQKLFNSFLHRWLLPVARQIPSLRVQEGNVVIFAPMPHSVTDPLSGTELMVFDTTGGIRNLDGRKASCLITESVVYIRLRPGAAPVELDLSFVSDFDGDPQRLQAWLESWGPRIVLIWLLEATVLSLFFTTIIVAVATTSGLLLMEASRSIDLSLRATARIAAVATAPSQLLVTAFDAVGYPLPVIVEWPLKVLMPIGYLCFGLWANREVGDSDSPTERSRAPLPVD